MFSVFNSNSKAWHCDIIIGIRDDALWVCRWHNMNAGERIMRPSKQKLLRFCCEAERGMTVMLKFIWKKQLHWWLTVPIRAVSAITTEWSTGLHVIGLCRYYTKKRLWGKKKPRYFYFLFQPVSDLINNTTIYFCCLLYSEDVFYMNVSICSLWCYGYLSGLVTKYGTIKYQLKQWNIIGKLKASMHPVKASWQTQASCIHTANSLKRPSLTSNAERYCGDSIHWRWGAGRMKVACNHAGPQA